LKSVWLVVIATKGPVGNGDLLDYCKLQIAFEQTLIFNFEIIWSTKWVLIWRFSNEFNISTSAYMGISHEFLIIWSPIAVVRLFYILNKITL